MTILPYISLGLAVVAVVAALVAMCYADRAQRLARKSTDAERHGHRVMRDAKALQQSDKDMALMLRDLKVNREQGAKE